MATSLFMKEELAAISSYRKEKKLEISFYFCKSDHFRDGFCGITDEFVSWV